MKIKTKPGARIIVLQNGQPGSHPGRRDNTGDYVNVTAWLAST